MPRGNPKKQIAARVDARLLANVMEHTTKLTLAIEDGLRLWLGRAIRDDADRAPSAERTGGGED